MNILKQIADTKRREVEATRLLFPLEGIRQAALRTDRPVRSLRRAVLDTPGGIIAEFKRRSPSRGEIAPMAHVADIVTQYVANGAAACSVLTDTPYFGGSIADLAIARELADIPLLRKEFVIDEYQIYQARIAGADAILLIASLLTVAEVRRFTSLAHQLQMEVLLELHNPDELSSVFTDIDLVGVNNRDLTNFNTDIAVSERMVSDLPSTIVKVAESGIRSPQDLARLKTAGFDGFLIGEAFMSTPCPGETLNNYINAK